MSTEKDMESAKRQALAQFESIAEMVKAVRDARARDAGEFDWNEEAAKRGLVIGEEENAEEACRAAFPREYSDEEEARQAIDEDALSVEVRSGWHNPCHPDKEAAKASEYRILLCTGGPAVQIVGDLDGFNQPETARLQFQDWFTPWTDLHWSELPAKAEDTLLEYARHFWFGE